jgi:hypothetical protein
MKVTKQAARKARFKLARSILTTYGYALVGGAVIQPITSTSATLNHAQAISAALGILSPLLAMYIAPQGD